MNHFPTRVQSLLEAMMKPLDLQDIIILMEDSDSEERDLLESALRNVLNNSAEMKKRSREARARSRILISDH